MNDRMRGTYLFFLAVSIGMCGCRKPEKQIVKAEPGAYAHGVWVANEGTFNYGNASVTFFSTTTGQTEADAFKDQNNGRPLGDVLQSMCHYGDKYYLVVNNSQKIVVAEDKKFEQTGEIDGLTSPRYFMPISADKAYVTDLYAKGIWVIDLQKGNIRSRIDFYDKSDSLMKGWTEQMLVVGKKAYVCAVKARAVLVIDTGSDKIIDTIPVGVDPQWMVVDKDNKLWVLCNAALVNGNSSLHCIDPVMGKVTKTLLFAPSASPSQLKINTGGDTLYYLDRGICRMGISATVLPASPHVAAGNHYFYGLGIAKDGSIYASDGMDALQKGYVIIYDRSGRELKTFPAGVLPNGFLFVE